MKSVESRRSGNHCENAAIIDMATVSLILCCNEYIFLEFIVDFFCFKKIMCKFATIKVNS